MKYDREKIRKAVAEYVYFLKDSHPSGPDDVTTWDSKRRKLHNAMFEAFGFDPARYGDKHIADSIDSIDKAFDGIEQFIDYHTDRLFDMFHNNDVRYGNGVETNYAFKDRIDKNIDYWKKKYGARIDLAKKAMHRAEAGLKCWNDDRPEGTPYVATWDAGINVHDFTGVCSSIDRDWEFIEGFAKMPREAFLKSVVKAYYSNKIEDIGRSIEKLESLAFQAMHTSYYTYPAKETNNAE